MFSNFIPHKTVKNDFKNGNGLTVTSPQLEKNRVLQKNITITHSHSSFAPNEQDLRFKLINLDRIKLMGEETFQTE